MDKERVSVCSNEESVLSEDLCEVTVEADSDGEERVLLPAGTAVRGDLINQSVSEAALGGTSGCTTCFLSCVACRVESQLALQLLMDRVLKKMLKNKADAIEQPSISEVIQSISLPLHNLAS